MTSDFELLPAIDLRDGRVVRLQQGDFARETVYGNDPVRVAESFAADGAGWLHVVDLDGARAGSAVQRSTIAAVIAAVGAAVRVEVAGGLRTVEAVRSALELGAARVVIGTAALRDPSFAGHMVREHGASRLAVSIDVRDGAAVGEGWRPDGTTVDVPTAIAHLSDVGVETFEVTAIERDGLLQGPDLDLLGSLVELGRGRVIASGGVSSVADLRAVADLGCAGAIVGRALYEGRLTIPLALAALRSGPR